MQFFLIFLIFSMHLVGGEKRSGSVLGLIRIRNSLRLAN